MKQKLLKTMLLLCALIVGTSSVWADTVTLTSAQIKAGSGSTSYGAASATDGGGNTWNAYAIKNQHSNATSNYHFWQIKKYASSTAYYVQVPSLGTKITQLVITVSGSSQARDAGSNTATLFFSSSNSTSAAGTGVASGTGASSVTIDCSSLNLNTGYITASGAVRIWDVEVTYTGKPSPELAWSAASYTATYGSSITYPTLSNPNSVTVSYSSSETNVATIDPSTGVITMKANGNTTITASFAGNATYKAQEVSYTLTVAGMKTAPGFSFATAEVNMTYDEDYTGQNLTNPNSLSVTYESSDTDVADVDEGTGELSLYKAGTVTITANYAGDATYASGSASYTINVTKAAAGLAFASAGPFKVAPDADFDVPAFTNPHSLTVAWSSTDEDVAYAGATDAVIGSKLGTAVITASFAGDDRYNASEVSYTIIVTNDIEVTWDLSKAEHASASENLVTWSKATPEITMTLDKGKSSTNANNYLGGTYDHIRIYKDQVLTINAVSGYSIKSIEITATSGTYSGYFVNSGTWTNAIASKDGSIVTVVPKDGTQNVSFTVGSATRATAITVTLCTSYEVSVSSVGYATYATHAPIDFSGSSIKAYIATANGRTGVTFTPVEKVPANTGILLYKSGGATEYFPIFNGSGAANVTGNVFVPGTGAAVASVIGEEETGKHNYILFNGASGLGFYKANGQTVAVDKAYIQIDYTEVTSVKGFIALPGSEETAVEAVKAEAEDGVIFNLAGQRVSKLQRGINIINGKKVVVK